MEKLKNRYPDLAFLLTFFSKSKKAKLSKNTKELEIWLEQQPLDDLQLLYIIGLIDCPLPKRIEKWLEEKKERALVFIEEELEAFAAFSQEELFDNPQIHFHYAAEDPIDELAQKFPTELLAIFTPKHKKFDSLRFLRKSAALSALYSDVLYSHFIVENVLTNSRRLKESFELGGWEGAFAGTPAIICGAGPSLEACLPTLREVENKALIFAGGTAIPLLSRGDIFPHFSIALDPNKGEWERLKQSRLFEIPFLFAPRLHKDVFCTTNGPFGYLQTDTGGLIEPFIEQELGISGRSIGPELGEEAFSVTTLALAYAHFLGCNPIFLAGVDLAFTGGKHYANGVVAEERNEDVRALEKPLICKDREEKEITTLVKWVMEAEALKQFAEKKEGFNLFTATSGGMKLDGIEYLPLEKGLAKMDARDLRAEVHQKIQQSSFPIDPLQLESLYEHLEKSLSRCLTITREILALPSQSGKRVFYKEELKEEKAYQALLQGVELALDSILPRYFPSLDPEKRGKECEEAKYRELLRQMEQFQKILIHQRSRLSFSRD